VNTRYRRAQRSVNGFSAAVAFGASPLPYRCLQVGPNRRVGGELREALDEMCELLKTTPPVALHWEVSRVGPLVLPSFRDSSIRWPLFTLRRLMNCEF
jgi:hypothetical protein